MKGDIRYNLQQGPVSRNWPPISLSEECETVTIVIDLPAETLTTLYTDEDDEEAAVSEASEQLSQGQGCLLAKCS